MQIIKAVLLRGRLIGHRRSRVGTVNRFCLPGFLQDVVSDPKVQARVATLLGDPAKNMSAANSDNDSWNRACT